MISNHGFSLVEIDKNQVVSNKVFIGGWLLIILTLMCNSCIYAPPIELTNVDHESSAPDIYNLSLDLEKDTIFIWTTTRFNFDLTTNGQPVVAIKISYIDQSFMFGNSAGHFDINPEDYTDGSYSLNMEIYTKSGTGSLADFMGQETNTTTKKWVLVIQRPYNLNVFFTGTSIENGFLKIRWSTFDSPFFYSYNIQVSDSALNHYFSKTYTDKDSTSLVDSSFVGDKVEFRLNLYYYDNNGILHASPADTCIFRFPIDFIIQDDLDSMTFQWTNIPFQHTVHIHSSLDNSTIDLGTDTIYKVRSPGFGGPLAYYLAVDPVINLTWDHQMYVVYKTYVAGTSTEMEFSNILCDPETNLWFVKHAMYFRKYNGLDFKVSGSYDYSWDYSDNTSIGLSPDKRFAFTTVSQELIQLSVPSFEIVNKKSLATSSDGTKSYHGMKILNDSLMYLVYNSRLALYNYKSNEIITYVLTSAGNGMPSQTSFSTDGMYIANCGDGALKLFRNYDNKSLDLIYQATGDYWECIFDPVNTQNLLVVTKDNNTILHCPGMEVLYDIPDNIKGIAVNFDPLTNNLLLVSGLYNKITVYDYLNDIVKFECNQHSTYNDFYLAKNTIFHNSGYYLNFNPDGK